jgi:hypothetical protein
MGHTSSWPVISEGASLPQTHNPHASSCRRRPRVPALGCLPLPRPNPSTCWTRTHTPMLHLPAFYPCKRTCIQIRTCVELQHPAAALVICPCRQHHVQPPSLFQQNTDRRTPHRMARRQSGAYRRARVGQKRLLSSSSPLSGRGSDSVLLATCPHSHPRARTDN